MELDQRALTLRGVTTDGSPLYPEPLALIFPGVSHQVCEFHILKEINKEILKAVAQVRRELKEKLPTLSKPKRAGEAGRPDIDAFEAVMTREDRTKGFFVSFDYSQDAMSEIQAFFKKSGKVIIPFTVKEILDEQIAYKLA